MSAQLAYEFAEEARYQRDMEDAEDREQAILAWWDGLDAAEQLDLYDAFVMGVQSVCGKVQRTHRLAGREYATVDYSASNAWDDFLAAKWAVRA